MKKNCIIALAALFVSIIFWIIGIILDPYIVPSVVGIILSTIICIGFGMICIVNKISAKVSPYLVFAITDIIIGVLVTIGSVYSMDTDEGIFGIILFLFVGPCSAVLLVIDIVLWMIKRSK